MRYVVCGLGNPGLVYKQTRHNVGFMAVDKLAQTLNLDWEKKDNYQLAKNDNLLIIKPQIFMNSSGLSLKKVIDLYKIPLSCIWVIHDDLDINLGNYKIQFGKGPKEHNGIKSIESQIGSAEFWRVRIGVEARGDTKIPGQAYVLAHFATDELKIVDNTLSVILKDLQKRIV